MPTALAPKPAKATASITLGWGLVNIPLSVYAATEATGVSRKEFAAKTGNPVGRIAIDKVTGALLTSDDVERKAQASDGSWVILRDDELIQVTAPAVKCEVVTFVPLAAIGTVYLAENYYQVRPRREKGNVDPNVEQGYALLLSAMGRREVAALVKLALRGPARFAAVLPDGRLVTLHYAEGVRESLPMPQVDLPEQVIALADQMIDLVGVGLPTLTDTNGPAIQAFVDAKAKGENPDPTPVAEAPSAQSLMDNLMASLGATEATTKPKPKRSKKAAA